ncbi:MAG: OmpH family outer membrane protein [Gammaproteobacteria bacterium]
MQKMLVPLFALGLLAAAPFAHAAASTDRIGLVDVQAIIVQSSAGKAAHAQMEAFRAQQEAIMKKKGEKLQQEHDAIEKNASIQTDAAQKEAQAQFQKEVQAFQAEGQKRQQELQKKSQALLQPIQAKLFNVIQVYAQQHGYGMILDKSVAIYNEDSLDLTDEISAAFKKAEASASAKGGSK